MDPSERADAISRLSQALQARNQEIADTISAQNGSPKQWSLLGQVFSSTMVLDTYADITRSYQWEDHRAGALGNPLIVRRAPVGVVAGIIPWNVALFIAALKLGPAMGGLPERVKPAPRRPRRYLWPSGARGPTCAGCGQHRVAGRETGEHWCATRRRQGELTGSTAVGPNRRISAAAQRFTLELAARRRRSSR